MASLILLYEGQSVIFNQINIANRFTVAGSSSLSGGILYRPPEEVKVGLNEYFAGYGLLLLGFLNIEDLRANQELIPKISGDGIRTGTW